MNAYATRSSRQILAEFTKFCQVDLRLQEKTVNDHVRKINKFLQFQNKNVNRITKSDVRDYLAKNRDKDPSVYKNILSALKRFFRDYLDRSEVVQGFKFPRKQFKLVTVPSKSELQEFYNHLPTIKSMTIFLMYATSGLRRNELLQLTLNDIDFQNRMIMPMKKANSTKNTYITFYNEEAERTLTKYLKTKVHKDSKLFYAPRTINQIFTRIKTKTSIDITPQILRKWFCCEMAKLGVQDRYVDAFCGRVPRSILARHYTDYSPAKLKEIYDNADLRVLS